MKISAAIISTVLVSPVAYAQVATFDSANFTVNTGNNVLLDAIATEQGAILTSNTSHFVSVLGNWSTSITNLMNILTKAQQYVQLATDMKTVIGDPTQLPALLDNQLLDGMVSADLKQFGAQVSDFVKVGDTAFALSQDIQDLYAPIDFQNPLDSYKSYIEGGGKAPYDRYKAMVGAFQNFNNQITRTTTEAERIRTAIAKLSKEAPKTASEQAKRQAEMQILQTQLAEHQRAVQSSYNQLQAMKTLDEVQERVEAKAAGEYNEQQADQFHTAWYKNRAEGIQKTLDALK